jgi:phosphate-selective porin
LKGRNESNVSDYYVDTKDIPADHAVNVVLEQLWSVQNISMLFEYVNSWVSTTGITEQFNGYYLTASWVLSGEQRPYDKVAGYARRIKPDGKGGAWELVGRVSRVDLTTPRIEGGILRKLMLGLNWLATQHWKVGVAYGISNLEKDNTTGITNSMQFRIQWIF